VGARPFSAAWHEFPGWCLIDVFERLGAAQIGAGCVELVTVNYAVRFCVGLYPESESRKMLLRDNSSCPRENWIFVG